MKDSVLDRISQQPVQPKNDDTLMLYDIKILQLETRMNSLENIMNIVLNKLGIYWNEKV